MRGHWWKIAKLELTLAMKDRESLIWSLAAPIAMAWLFGTMFGSDGPPQPTHVKITGGVNPPELVQQAKDYIGKGEFVVADDGIEVVLPDSVAERIQSGKPIHIRVIQGDADAMRAQAVSAKAREFAYFAVLHPAPQSGAVNTEPLLSVAASTRGSAPKIASGKERMLPSMLIMYIMFQVMTFFLSLWVDDLRSGK